MDCSEVVDRLTRRFGMGSKPELRKALYERLGRIVEDGEVGEEALHIISTVAADSVGKRTPAQYFAWVVMRRLMDRGIIGRPEL